MKIIINAFLCAHHGFGYSCCCSVKPPQRSASESSNNEHRHQYGYYLKMEWYASIVIAIRMNLQFRSKLVPYDSVHEITSHRPAISQAHVRILTNNNMYYFTLSPQQNQTERKFNSLSNSFIQIISMLKFNRLTVAASNQSIQFSFIVFSNILKLLW